MTSIQKESGLFLTTTVKNLLSGFGLFDGSLWKYGTTEHLAPTAWFIMAIHGFNQYVFS